MTDRPLAPAGGAGPFIDLHCHLLPGVDDGPESVEDSLELCRAMVRQGVHTATATPHQSHTWPDNSAERIRREVTALRERLASAGIPLEVLPGADIRVDSDFMPRWLKGELISIADRGKAVLLELPDNVLLPLGELSFQLRVRRVVPVLTHPERCTPLQDKWATLTEWVEQGMVLQVTTGSLLGEFGRRAEVSAVEMTRRGLVGFYASDAHGPERRAPNYRAAYDRLAGLFGEGAARTLMIEHPARVLEGRSVPPVAVRPAEPEAPPPSRGFSSRLFGG